MGQANINRGKKWKDEIAKAEFENRKKDIEWMQSQKSITDDIEEYENSIKQVETKSKGKK